MAAAFWRCVSDTICSQKRKNQMLLKYRKFTGKERPEVIMTVVCLLIETLVNECADMYWGVLLLLYRYFAYFRYRLKRKSCKKPAAWFSGSVDCACVRNTGFGLWGLWLSALGQEGTWVSCLGDCLAIKLLI